MTDTPIGAITRLSALQHPEHLPNSNTGIKSNYMKLDQPILHLDHHQGIVGDHRAVKNHQIRDRDIMFTDLNVLDRVVKDDGPPMIGQNVTVEDADTLSWCVGDLIRIGDHALVRITSVRKPCPKNDTVHYKGTQKLMEEEGLGGIFGRIEITGDIHVGDTIYLVDRPNPDWTCQDVHIALYGKSPSKDANKLQQIAGLPYLEEPRYKQVAEKRFMELQAYKKGMAVKLLYVVLSAVILAWFLVI
eukprot:TRINITY_DN3377_c0_g2_i1.p2 TRINITY_DN3377_c0_g2~~TRINITY_DN3377_c0_g2_i1.p2  ORF type:complete len:245 (+),score=34.37 TRINITY_DN3377_c0_g2_i1:3-737(+)